MDRKPKNGPWEASPRLQTSCPGRVQSTPLKAYFHLLEACFFLCPEGLNPCFTGQIEFPATLNLTPTGPNFCSISRKLYHQMPKSIAQKGQNCLCMVEMSAIRIEIAAIFGSELLLLQREKSLP